MEVDELDWMIIPLRFVVCLSFACGWWLDLSNAERWTRVATSLVAWYYRSSGWWNKMILPIFSDQCPHFWNVEYHLSIVTGDDFANDVVILRCDGRDRHHHTSLQEQLCWLAQSLGKSLARWSWVANHFLASSSVVQSHSCNLCFLDPWEIHSCGKKLTASQGGLLVSCWNFTPLMCQAISIHVCMSCMYIYPHLHVSIRMHLYTTSLWHRSHLPLSQICIDEI